MVDVELAGQGGDRGTLFGRVWGGGKVGNEFAVWCWIALAVFIAEICASARREQLEGIRRVWRWVRSRRGERLNEGTPIEGNLI